MPVMPTSLSTFTEEENDIREAGPFDLLLIPAANSSAVKAFARDVVAPRTSAMDEAEKMDPVIIKGLFDQGVSRVPGGKRR